jgi:cytochrome c biogenesis protein CcmG, thiol:disulfide interchange protein DsbE
MNRLLLLPLVLFLGLAAFLFVGLRRDPREIPSPLVDKAAPDFKLSQLKEPNKMFSPQEMRGKVWVLNFWGTWCVACRDEHPLLLQYAKSGALPIYGVDYKDDRAAALQMLEEEGNPYTMTMSDPEGRTSIDYGVYGAPESYLIDRNGVIRFKQIGPITEEVWQKEFLRRAAELK